jgi:hypothetical protein
MVKDDSCEAKFLQNTGWAKSLDAVHKVYAYILLFQNASTTNGVHLRLPTEGESYSSYLMKSQLDKGLVATFLFDKFYNGLSNMQNTIDNFKGKKNKATVCIDDINVLDLSSSNKDLSQLLKKLQFKSGMTFTGQMTKNHFLDHKKVASYGPMMKDLREWDAEVNNEELAVLEKQLSCGMTGLVEAPAGKPASAAVVVETAPKKKGFSIF